MRKYILIILWGVFLSSEAFGQSSNAAQNPIAEDLFENILPIGVGIGVQYATWKEKGKRSDFNFDQSNLWMPELYFSLNIFQKKNFNFKSGLNVRYITHNSFSLPAYGNPDPNVILKSSVEDITFHIPLTLEHINKLNDNYWLVFHGGYELQYYMNKPYQTNHQRNFDPQGTLNLTSIAFKDKISHGINFGTGIYRKLGRKLVKLELNYHLHFNKMIEQNLRSSDISGYENISATNSWPGNHIDFKTTFYLFNQNKK